MRAGGFWVEASGCLTGQVLWGLRLIAGAGGAAVSRDSGSQTGVSAGLG